MQIAHQKSLSNYVTMRLGGPAKAMAIVKTEDDLVDAVDYADQNHYPIIVIGNGSNIIFSDVGFEGLVIVNKLTGLTIDTSSGILTASSGEWWDDCVKLAVINNFSGIEALSLIPGSAGAAPVNNIGAYGQEIKDTLVRLRAYDTEAHAFIELPAVECEFSYRDSIFKTKDYGRYIITQITLQLHDAKTDYIAPNYGSLSSELLDRGVIKPTIQNVRDAVIALRSSKLPDPAVLPNSGSFFKNPIVPEALCDALLLTYPNMPYFKHSKGMKLAAGWLIDNAGLKGYKKDGIRVYEKQALVLVNDGTKSYTALDNMKKHIQQTVLDKYGIMLEPEPELL